MKFYTKSSGGLSDRLYKFLWIMRLIIILLITGFLQVSAATYGQRLSLSGKNIPVKQVFKEIKKQTGYDVLWQSGSFNANEILPTVNFKDTPLQEVISQCLLDHKLFYTIDDQSIVISPQTVRSVTTMIRQDSILYIGRILDENGKPMIGATIRVKYGKRSFLTNKNGEFRIYAPKGESILQVSYIGYTNREVQLNGKGSLHLDLELTPAIGTLSEVQVVTNGYQDLPKERATGSFEVITAKQLEHSTDPNLLKRLEGITTSMNFNNQVTPTITGPTAITNRYNSSLTNLTIRGRNTLAQSIDPNNTSGIPLLVIDGIPNPYDISLLDPNEVESVTILKDAAAASIWGAQAANGVIVVKTKRGNYKQPTAISFNTSFNLADKPDLFYRPKMSVSDFINAQAYQFIQAKTNLAPVTVGSSQSVKSPVAEIMNKLINLKTITQEQANAQLDALRGNDVRNDVSKYVLRDAIDRNYNLGISGGSNNLAYHISAGYSNSTGNTQGANSDRLVLSYSSSLKLIKGLELTWNANYTLQNEANQNPNTAVGTNYTQFQPYSRLADDNGNPLIVPKTYRPDFIALLNSTYGNKILDMTYKPLEEMNLGSFKTKLQGINLGTNAVYTINPSFSVNITYSYNKQLRDEQNFISRNSFYMRELINRFTDPTTFTRVISYGDYYQPNRITGSVSTLRGQLNYNHIWNDKHALNAIAGIQGTQSNIYVNDMPPYYGYDPETLIFNNTLNYVTPYPTLWSNFGVPVAVIPYTASFSNNLNRTLSSYANAAYTYNNRYTLSASIRKDGSSVFGPTQNRTGTPFYSTGVSWNIANEDFYPFAFLSHMQFRATFGYNGNSNPSVAPVPTIFNGAVDSTTGLPYTQVFGATNTRLRPERTGVLNFGLDFGVKNERLIGSLEYYVKNTKDLITSNLLDPSTGFSSLGFNTGNLHGYGTDLTLNSQNVKAGKFLWSSNFLLSYNRVKVTQLYIPGGTTARALVEGAGGNASQFNVGYDLSRIFAYPWAGLDPQTGSPRLLLNGRPITISNDAQGTNNFLALGNGPNSNAKYIGSAVPVYFGSLRNTFSYGSFSISANILYKFKYYSRRPIPDLSLSTMLYQTNPVLVGAEYSSRWQKPGDELLTNVPALNYPSSVFGDVAYQYADINVIKADHIRLQEINLSYAIKKIGWKVKNLQISANITNLGIIWRANKLGIDPDINDVPQPKTYSIGLNANF